jgi:hypothetical protein
VTGVFNVEGGCYAKVIKLRRENEPDIYDAIRFGTVLENVTFDLDTRDVNYDNKWVLAAAAAGCFLTSNCVTKSPDSQAVCELSLQATCVCYVKTVISCMSTAVEHSSRVLQEQDVV